MHQLNSTFCDGETEACKLHRKFAVVDRGLEHGISDKECSRSWAPVGSRWEKSFLETGSNSSFPEVKPRKLRLYTLETEVEWDYISQLPLRNSARRRPTEVVCVLPLPMCSGRGGDYISQEAEEGAGRGRASVLRPPLPRARAER